MMISLIAVATSSSRWWRRWPGWATAGDVAGHACMMMAAAAGGRWRRWAAAPGDRWWRLLLLAAGDRWPFLFMRMRPHLPIASDRQREQQRRHYQFVTINWLPSYSISMISSIIGSYASQQEATAGRQEEAIAGGRRRSFAGNMHDVR